MKDNKKTYKFWLAVIFVMALLTISKADKLQRIFLSDNSLVFILYKLSLVIGVVCASYGIVYVFSTDWKNRLDKNREKVKVADDSIWLWLTRVKRLFIPITVLIFIVVTHQLRQQLNEIQVMKNVDNTREVLLFAGSISEGLSESELFALYKTDEYGDYIIDLTKLTAENPLSMSWLVHNSMYMLWKAGNVYDDDEKISDYHRNIWRNEATRYLMNYMDTESQTSKDFLCDLYFSNEVSDLGNMDETFELISEAISISYIKKEKCRLSGSVFSLFLHHD